MTQALKVAGLILVLFLLVLGLLVAGLILLHVYQDHVWDDQIRAIQRQQLAPKPAEK